MVSGIKVLAEGIAEELHRLLPRQRKTQRTNLALLVATMLDVRSANLMDLAAGLPREAERIDMRYQWIARVLAKPLIDPDGVMAPFAREVLGRLAAAGQPLVLILDQSKLNDRHQVLMLAVRQGERALPLLWRVEATDGAIGFAVQKALLEAALALLPEGAAVCLMADRFYGTADLIAWCQERAWDYRLRLKGNLVVRDACGRTLTGCLAKDRVFALEDVRLTAREATTNIGVIHDPGHAEPWIIAMAATPGYLKTLEYSSRWAIEPMFSDFKSRGFGVENSQIQHPDRLARLLLVMALAIYTAVSTGLWDAQTNPTPAEKKASSISPKSSPAQRPLSSPGG
jgi:Transposase DDE domain